MIKKVGKEMDKKTKITLIVISVVMILVAVIIVVSKLIAPTTSTNNTNANIKDTTIDGLRISNVNLVGNHLTAYVQNTTSNSISIKTITVKFIDKDNNEIERVDAYFGGVFASNEIRNLDVKTDADLPNLKNISYEVNKTSCTIERNTNFRTISGIINWPGTFTGIYQCDGVTGYLDSCLYSGTNAKNYNETKYFSRVPLNVGCCTGSYRSGNDLILRKCNSSFHSNASLVNPPKIATSISCSCGD